MTRALLVLSVLGVVGCGGQQDRSVERRCLASGLLQEVDGYAILVLNGPDPERVCLYRLNPPGKGSISCRWNQSGAPAPADFRCVPETWFGSWDCETVQACGVDGL